MTWSFRAVLREWYSGRQNPKEREQRRMIAHRNIRPETPRRLQSACCSMFHHGPELFLPAVFNTFHTTVVGTSTTTQQ
jgi:hypothetical protein